MTAPEGYGRTAPAPLCGCGAPSVWIDGITGRSCEECPPHRSLPAGLAWFPLRGWLSRRIDAAFASVRVDR